MSFLRSRLSYANVVSTIALFLALTGGAVYAAGKIGTDDLAANAVKTKQIAPGAVHASDMATPVKFVAKAHGGSGNFTNSTTDYPLSGKTTWTQGPKEVDQFFVEAKGTVASDPTSPFPTPCFANVIVKVDDQQVASAGVFSGAGTAVGTGALMDTGDKDKRQMTASLQSFGCSSDSRVDSVTIRGIGTG